MVQYKYVQLNFITVFYLHNQIFFSNVLGKNSK